MTDATARLVPASTGSARTQLVLRGWLSSWKVMGAIVVIALDVVLQFVLEPKDPLAPMLDYVAAFALGLSVRGLFHAHVLVPGRTLVPGVLGFHARLLFVVLGLGLAPVILAAMTRGPLAPAWIAMVPVGLMLGLVAATLRNGLARGVVFGLVGGSFGLSGAMLDRIQESGNADHAIFALFGDPWRLALIGGPALLIAGWAILDAVRSDDTVNWARNSGRAPSQDCSTHSDAETVFLVRVFPFLRRRPLTGRVGMDLPTVAEASASWRSAGDAIHPAGLAVVLSVFINAISLEPVLSKGVTEAMRAGLTHLFIAMGPSALATGYLRRSLRVESLRPVDNGALIAGLARALAIDVVQFAGTLSAIQIALYAAFDASVLRDVAFWQPWIPVPATVALGLALTFLLGRWTPKAGLIGFVGSGILSIFALQSLEDVTSTAVWLTVTFAGLATAAALTAIARRAWADYEPGMR